MQENKEVDVEYDLGNLCLYNSQNIDLPSEKDRLEKKLEQISVESFRKLFGKLNELRMNEESLQESKKLELQIHDFDKTEFHVNLPEGTTLFPRVNPIPKEKEVTKWEKYARENGIAKKKKTQKVFDEATQTWVNRFGSKGMTKLREKRDVVRELKPGQDIYTDVFEEDRLQKKEKKQKEQIKEIRNKLRAKGHDPSNAQTPEQRFEKVKAKKDKLKKIKMAKKEKLAANLKIAQSSTASMGKFDKRVSKDEVQKSIQKKKQKMDGIFDAKKEVERNKE